LRTHLQDDLLQLGLFVRRPLTLYNTCQHHGSHRGQKLTILPNIPISEMVAMTVTAIYVRSTNTSADFRPFWT
jgi:hypothetical protein